MCAGQLEFSAGGWIFGWKGKPCLAQSFIASSRCYNGQHGFFFFLRLGGNQFFSIATSVPKHFFFCYCYSYIYYESHLMGLDGMKTFNKIGHFRRVMFAHLSTWIPVYLMARGFRFLICKNIL